MTVPGQRDYRPAPAGAGPGRTVLVVAKAPVPGRVKTRLIGTVSAAAVADIAAAALLDTLDTAAALPDAEVVVALAGDLRAAARYAELADRLSRCRLIGQHGQTFGERLYHAHLGVGGGAVVQLAMDTPQVTVELLEDAFVQVPEQGAAIGPTVDGGWWALGLAAPEPAVGLTGVAMSTSQTYRDTVVALIDVGSAPATLPTLIDVDTWSDALAVALEVPPDSHFAKAMCNAKGSR